MTSSIRIFAFLLLATAIAGAQIVRTWTSASIVGVPSSGTGGQAGGAGNPANVAQLTTVFEGAMVTGHVFVSVSIDHARVGDLTMTLSHCGTTVTLFSGSANQLASVNGAYVFADYTPNSFATAVAQAQGLVPPGAYQPAQPLSAFAGKGSAGPWVLTIADLASGVSGVAGFMEVTVDHGSNFGYPIVPSMQIPDSANGTCSNPLTHVINVPTSGQVGMMSLALELNHTFASDLMIVVSHAGVTATIMAPPPYSSANLGGLYTFEDWAPTSYASSIIGVPDMATVPPGHYRPATPFSVFQGLDRAGPWFVTICDLAAFDTGSFGGAYLTIAGGSWNLAFSQPSGPSWVTLTNTGGMPGHFYANLMTVVPGAFPSGWLYGLDITMFDVLGQLTFGPPFSGALDPCGAASITIPGPIPSGLTLYVTALEFDLSGSVIAAKPAFAYTTP